MNMESGVIIPPQNIKNLVDKTARSIAQRGSELEELVKKNFIDNPQFSFLKYNDPYRPYFDQKVQEFKAGGGDGDMEPQEDGKQKTSKKDIKPPEEPKFIYDCGSVPVVDNDIIQHTAQFVAANGKRFLIALTEREKNNPQFDFLKPTHSMFPYFTSLIDSYSRILEFSENEVKELLTYVSDKKSILRSCSELFEYEAETQYNKRRKEELDEEERTQRAMIDWNDFVVVQTIEFEDNDDNLPAPIDLAVREKLHHMEFTKANINPEFAFMLDASQVFAANLAKKAAQGSQQGLDGTNGKESLKAYEDKVYINTAPQLDPSAMAKKQKADQSSDITINLRVASSGTFGEFAGKSLSIQINPELTVSNVLAQFTSRIKSFPDGCRLRSVEHDILDDQQTFDQYNIYNGAVLELLPPN